MSYKYIVSYGVMDTDAGANPFGHHAYLLLSRQHANGQLEVVDSIGYYSTPQSDSNPVFREAKKSMGVSFNLRGSYGYLKREKPHEFAIAGTTAMHFEVTKKQAQQFLDLSQARIQKEQARIKSYGEMLPQQIIVAEQQREDSVLKRFRWEVTLYPLGLFKPNYYTCKNDALNTLLKLGISEQALMPLNYGVQGQESLPIASGSQLEPLRIFYKGQRTLYPTSKGDVISFDWPKTADGNIAPPALDLATNIFWMHPPQVIYDANGKASPYCQQQALSKLHQTLYKMQKLELKLRKTYLFPMPEQARNQFYQALHDIYQRCQAINQQTSEQQIDALNIVAEQALLGMETSLDYSHFNQIQMSSQLMLLAKTDAVLTLCATTLKLLALAGLSVTSPALPFVMIGAISSLGLYGLASYSQPQTQAKEVAESDEAEELIETELTTPATP